MVDKTVPIPYVQLVISLASFTIPILIGIGIKYKWPRLGEKIQKISRPFFFVCLIIFPVVGSLQNSHFFYLCTWRTIISGALLGILGYIFGALLAFVAKQGKPQVNIDHMIFVRKTIFSFVYPITYKILTQNWSSIDYCHFSGDSYTEWWNCLPCTKFDFRVSNARYGKHSYNWILLLFHRL